MPSRVDTVTIVPNALYSPDLSLARVSPSSSHDRSKSSSGWIVARTMKFSVSKRYISVLLIWYSFGCSDAERTQSVGVIAILIGGLASAPLCLRQIGRAHV